MKITVLQGFWFKKKKIALEFPDKWKVDHCRMRADGWKILSEADIKKAVDRPMGCESLESIAKGKKEAVILFDDMTRPTKPYKVIPFILEKLKSAGIEKRSIRFIVSTGSHGAHRPEDFRKKLGSYIVANYPVYNHNCFENCKYIGKTSTDVPLYLNKEFVLCDLKIGIGSALPHIYCGLSGGGKIILPGISHIRTIDKFHSLDEKSRGFGNRIKIRRKSVRSIYEAVELANFQFKIDFIVNSEGDEVACLAGDPNAVHRKAIKIAESAYTTAHGKNYDVIIANAYAKSNGADQAIYNVNELVNPKNGIIVLITHNPHGQINHYLMRSYGKFIAGRRYNKRAIFKPNVKYIVFSPYKDYNAFDALDKQEILIWKNSWKDILKIIKNDFSDPKIAVFSDATIQII